MRSFIAARGDLEPGIRAFEALVPMCYVARGFHSKPKPEIFMSALDIPCLGHMISLDYQHGERKIYPTDGMSSQNYLAYRADMELVILTVPQAQRGILYWIDMERNPRAIMFTPGGYTDDGVLRGGPVARETEPHMKEFATQFARSLT